MWGHLPRLTGLLVLLFLALTVDTGHASGDRLVSPTLMHRAIAEGTARVIVELGTVAVVPEGWLPDEWAVADQRRQLRQVGDTVRQALAGASHRVVREFRTVPVMALEASPEALRRLETLGGPVLRITEDALNRPRLSQSAPLVDAPRAWDAGLDGRGTVIAVLDTGVDGGHPFLAGKVIQEACYSSTTNISVSLCSGGQPTQAGPGSAAPCTGRDCDHGTHVAGVAAGHGAEAGQPFSGIARGAAILAIQVYSLMTTAGECEGAPPCLAAFTSDLIAGLEHVYELRQSYSIAAVNMSLGNGRPVTANCDGDPAKPIIDTLRSAGIATVIASGNSGSVDGIEAPACISSAVSVAATTKADRIASVSNVASFLALLAPGVSITSSVPGGGYAAFSGTSVATPHVAGAFAILRQARPTAAVSELLSALQATGFPIADVTGIVKPRIQIGAALNLDRLTLLTAFVSGLYENVLGRLPDPGGLASWVEFLEASCDPAGFDTIGVGFLESGEFRTARPVTITGLARALYRAFLDREPEPGVLAAWSEGFRALGVAIARGGFIPSSEFQSMLPNRADPGAVAAVVTRFYREILGRDPDPGGLSGWVNHIAATGDVEGTAIAFLTSAEFEGRAFTLREYVGVFYRALLGRDPDPPGLAGWERAVGDHLTGVVRDVFIHSAEFEARGRRFCGG